MVKSPSNPGLFYGLRCNDLRYTARHYPLACAQGNLKPH